MEFITYEQEGFVGVITINRPKALNALNSQVLKEIDATLDAVNLETTRCLILTVAGEKSCVAGADIAEMSTLTKAEANKLKLDTQKKGVLPREDWITFNTKEIALNIGKNAGIAGMCCKVRSFVRRTGH